MKTETHMERRSFVKRLLLIAGGTVSGGGLVAILLDVWFAAGRFSSAHWRSLTVAKTLAGDGIFPFPEQGVALMVRKKTVAAISLECTHLGCLLNVIDDGFFCPCHGSEFGTMGEVYTGPATRSLPWHDIKIDNGKIWVQSVATKDSPIWKPLDTRAGDTA